MLFLRYRGNKSFSLCEIKQILLSSDRWVKVENEVKPESKFKNMG